MKQKHMLFIAFSLLIIVIFLAGCRKAEPNLEIENFILDEYKQEIATFPPQKSYDSFNISTGEDALAAAETVIADVYDNVEEKEPYSVYYDESTKAWMVKGSLPKGMNGGVPYVIFNQDGEVLAVWHTK